MEEQLIIITLAGAVSSFFISSIKGYLSKKGEDHELTDDQVALIVGSVCLVSALSVALFKNDFQFTAITTDFAGVLGSSYIIYKAVMKRKIQGKTIDDYIEQN